ncbi:MAG: PadR family transcriptional regulator [Bacteroidetes bacterium]|nr:PadR family transcriptional regulator [Bacteroidota bacterium]
MYSKELLRGTFKTIVLKLLAENGRMYGYEITQKMKLMSNDKITITEGSLYPLLHKLEQDGVLTTEIEQIGKRTRRYYKLTEQGTGLAQQMVDEFKDFMQTMKTMLDHGSIKPDDIAFG